MGGSTDNHTIAENTAGNTNLGTFSAIHIGNVKSEGFIEGIQIDISYSNCNTKVFGSFIIYSFIEF
jgi:hypothetical protein